jgi:hypothetical protein
VARQSAKGGAKGGETTHASAVPLLMCSIVLGSLIIINNGHESGVPRPGSVARGQGGCGEGRAWCEPYVLLRKSDADGLFLLL